MRKISDITSYVDEHDEFTDGEPEAGVIPTPLLAEWFTMIQRELVKVVESAGLTLDPKDDTQVWQALSKYFAATTALGSMAYRSDDGSDIPEKDTFVRNIGACLAFSGSVSIGGDNGNWTTAQFIEWLESQGAFNHPYWMCKGSLAYDSNKIITDTGCGNIQLAGSVVEVMGTRNAITIRVTTPTTVTSGTPKAQFTYINHGDSYSPGWRRDWNRGGDTMTGKLILPQTSGFGVNTDNALGGNSITLGDNDTGIKQGGDGVLLFYLNGQLAFGLQPASADFYKRVAYTHQGITPEGSGAFADQLNNATAPFVQTRFAWNPAPGGHYVPIVKGLSVRNGQGYPGAVSFGYLLTEQQGFPVPCIHMRGDNGNEALWQFNPNDKSFFSPGPVIAGGATLASNGDINGAAWGGWLSAYLRNNTGVQDVRYGSEMYYNPGGNQVSWTFRSPSGHGLSGINVQETGSNSADNIGGVYYRPLQKLINGTWYNVASV